MNIKDKAFESSIKALIINKIFIKDDRMPSADNKFIIDEFSIANFTRRVDLILANNYKLYAFEVKSDFDSLIRLKGQVDEYLEHFDKVTVVAASKHIDKALQLTPEQVAIWEVSEGKLKIIRRGKVIPITDKFKYIKMMTLVELLNFAKKMNIDIKDKKRKMVELSLLNIPTIALKKQAIDNLRNRYKKRGKNYFDKNNFSHYGFNKKNESRRKNVESKSIDSLIHSIENL